MARNVKSYAELAANPAYELMYEEYLSDIKTAGIVLRHKKSGARVCVLSNDDENKLFCAGFKTPPTNSTGVPHIIEHSVLNGSKNFPSRDPFMQLVKSSLNTFLNAMTYPDKTLYPVASCNDKDFANLMNVYMDSVFYPNIYNRPFTFMQEGWHYEMDSAEDELKINGVVYSEMKGAMSSPDRAVYDYLSQAGMPDTTYGVNSGGDPDVIPELSYEEFLAFHSRYYHPVNSYIFVYGNCDMDERLAWMDENYLSKFDKIDFSVEIAKQPHFGTKEPKKVIEYYSVGENDETEGKAYLAFSTLAGSNSNAFECRANNILSTVLINSDSAPVKEALIAAGIGEDIYGGFEDHMIEDAFMVIAKNAKAEDIDRFYEVVIDTLKKQVEEGISEKALRAAINTFEFNFREANYGGFPKGLDYAITMLGSWLYDDNAAFNYMHTLSDIEELKAKIGTGYYEGLIKKYILESDHTVLLSLLPERGLVDKKNAELKEKLAAYKASLTDAEIEKIVADTKALREYQAMPPTEEELNCIPTLQRSDISRDTIPFYNEERTVGGCKTVYHDVDTSGITYANIYFRLGKMPKKYVPYVGLLGNLLGRIDTAERNYNDLTLDIRLNTGSITFAPTSFRKFGTMDEYEPMFGIMTRVLADKVDYAVNTALEIITSSKFEDTKRIKNILAEIKSDKQREVMMAGHTVSMKRAISYFSKHECYAQHVSGLDFYFFLSDLIDNFDAKADEMVENLKKTAAYIFNPANIIVSLATDEAGYKALDEALPAFAEALSKIPHDSLGEGEEFIPTKKNEGILIPSQVQYVGRAGNLLEEGVVHSGVFNVMNNCVNIDHLYQQVRVRGGAYGCGCSVGGDSGNVAFYSYRDPKLKETYDVYSATSEFVRNLDLNEDELTKNVIGTFSRYERPMSPSQKASRSFDAYMSGKTYEDVVREREEMLGVTMDQIHAAADIYDKIVAQGYVCTVGSEKAVKDNAELFDNLVTIF
ncbi:MAG: insulinase family protein [Ruminococcaceae bacterium]|nr:insulinase family protein [Oscillospiraceae bacterium]